MLYAEWFFIEGEKVRMPTERRTAGWHMYQGVVHTSLRLRSRIYNNSLGERLLFRAWNFPRSKQASSQQRYKLFRRCYTTEQRRLWMWKRGHLVPWKRVKVCTSSRPRLCPCKNLRGAKLVSVHPPSIHYRENLDFTPAGIRVAFSYRQTQAGMDSGLWTLDPGLWDIYI